MKRSKYEKLFEFIIMNKERLVFGSIQVKLTCSEAAELMKDKFRAKYLRKVKHSSAATN